MNGFINNSVTTHYWKVTIAANGYLLVKVNSEIAIDLTAVIYDSDTTGVISNDSRTGPYSEVWGLLKPGTYYIKIFRFTGTTGSYSTNVTLTPPPRTGEPEINDTAPFAAPLSPNSFATGNIGFYGNRKGDRDDYWKIRTLEDGWLRVQVRADSMDLRNDGFLIDLNAFMFDTNGTSQISYDFRSGTFSEVWSFVQAGTYFVNVTLFAGRAGSYQINADLFPPSRPNDPDGNDSPQTASTAIVNGTVTGHVNYLRGGIVDSDDYWKFTLPADGKVVVQLVADSLDNVKSTVELDLGLYEVNGTRLDRFALDARYGTFSECAAYLIGGRTFYARVTRVAGHGASYSMTVAYTPAARTGDTEPNDWYGAATPLTPNVLTTGHIGFFGFNYADAYDFWKITATSDSLYVHVTSDPTLEVNLAAWGQDTTINSYLALDTRAGIYSRVGIKTTVGQTYYFRVDRAFSLPSWYSIIATRTSFAVAVEKSTSSDMIPGDLFLGQNYPNPFNPSTTIAYGVPETQPVQLSIYSVLGQKVADLVNATQPPATYRIAWNGRDVQGVDMPSGIYFIRLQTGTMQIVRKAMLVR